MRKAWDPQHPIETMFKQIQYYVEFSEAGGVTIGAAQQISVTYTQVFVTRSFMIFCRHCNEKEEANKTRKNLKTHFAGAYHQHKQIQGESATTSGYNSANAAVAHAEEEMAEATIGVREKLATATSADRGVVSALIEVNSRLAKQLEERSNKLKESGALLRKERTWCRYVTPPLDN
jgi:hypothetical protein